LEKLSTFYQCQENKMLGAGTYKLIQNPQALLCSTMVLEEVGRTESGTKLKG